MNPTGEQLETKTGNNSNPRTETWLNTEQRFRSTITEYYASTRNTGLMAAMTTESFLRADAKAEGYSPKSMCTHTARVLETTSTSVAREAAQGGCLWEK